VDVPGRADAGHLRSQRLGGLNGERATPPDVVDQRLLPRMGGRQAGDSLAWSGEPSDGGEDSAEPGVGAVDLAVVDRSSITASAMGIEAAARALTRAFTHRSLIFASLVW
jgi:hypothetical protein